MVLEQTTLRNIPEERIPHLHRGGSLQSRIILFYYLLKGVTNQPV
jgi:hypothetical protein